MPLSAWGQTGPGGSICHQLPASPGVTCQRPLALQGTRPPRARKTPAPSRASQSPARCRLLETTFVSSIKLLWTLSLTNLHRDKARSPNADHPPALSDSGRAHRPENPPPRKRNCLLQAPCFHLSTRKQSCPPHALQLSSAPHPRLSTCTMALSNPSAWRWQGRKEEPQCSRAQGHVPETEHNEGLKGTPSPSQEAHSSHLHNLEPKGGLSSRAQIPLTPVCEQWAAVPAPGKGKGHLEVSTAGQEGTGFAERESTADGHTGHAERQVRSAGRLIHPTPDGDTRPSQREASVWPRHGREWRPACTSSAPRETTVSWAPGATCAHWQKSSDPVFWTEPPT